MVRHRGVQEVPESALAEALFRTPVDQYVIWSGLPAGKQTGSLRSRALALVDDPWRPISLRALMQRAARIEGQCGLKPELVRDAVRLHQAADPCVYFLVKQTPAGDYVTVTEVPSALGQRRPIPAGELIRTRTGEVRSWLAVLCAALQRGGDAAAARTRRA